MFQTYRYLRTILFVVLVIISIPRFLLVYGKLKGKKNKSTRYIFMITIKKNSSIKASVVPSLHEADRGRTMRDQSARARDSERNLKY